MKKTSIIIGAVCAFALCSCEQERQVGIVAHRGYWNCEQGGGAHNSIAALQAAQDLSFWGSEFDVNMTKDEELMVFHDSEVEGKAFKDYNAAEFADIRLCNGEKIPTLDEYLTQFEKNKKCRLVFELKWHATPELERRAVELSIEKLKAHGLFNPKQVIFISFSFNQCKLFAELAPGFTVQYLGGDEEHNPDVCAQAGINGIDTGYWVMYKDPSWYQRARNNSMSVNVWTVDKVEDMRKCIEMGCDYITTNKPELCRSLLQEMGIKELKAGKNL